MSINAEAPGPPLRQMKILIVSAYIPPFAPFGAVRVPSLAHYWLKKGADVRLVGSKTTLFEARDILPFPAEHVTYVGFGSATEPPPLHGEQKPYKAWITQTMPGLMNHLRYWSTQLFELRSAPDPFRPWADKAFDATAGWHSTWQPDLIVSSGPPHSSHILANRLKKRFGCAWIAELRDPWSSNPYTTSSSLVRARNRLIERSTLKSANALVALTRSEQQGYQSRYDKPVIFVRNGFVPEDAAIIDMVPRGGDDLLITHAGSLYGGKRDPRLLLEAIRLLGNDSKFIRLRLIGEAAVARTLVSDYPDLMDQVEILPVMAQHDVLKHYSDSDILLMLRWDDPREHNFVAGKLFEYIAARRPILNLGYAGGEAADIIRDHGLGLVAQSTEEAAFALRGWLETKRRLGQVPLLPANTTEEFHRDRQFRQLDLLIDSLGVGAHS